MENRMRSQLLAIFNAALAAVEPGEALLRHSSVKDGFFRLDNHVYDLSQGKVRVVGAGKGAASLAGAFENLAGVDIAEGLVIVKRGHGLPLRKIRVIEASHPEPDEAGRLGARELLEIAGRSSREDALVVLLTGGASALTPAPAFGLDLDDLQRATRLLLACGATIAEINAIRKHLSFIGGGQLARAANGAAVFSIIVSDVIGDDLGVIASGPTAPDETTYDDCLDIVRKYGLSDKMPAKVMEVLREGGLGHIHETPKGDEAFFSKTHNVIVASNAQALDAAARMAGMLGFAVERLETPMTGEAENTARKLIAVARRKADSLECGCQDICLLAGGETTVTVRGSGKGGRNQHMALAAAIELEGNGRIGCLFAGTDGTDGPTDANGGYAFGNSVDRLGGRQEAIYALGQNDSYTALKKSHDLLITGPTRTNVMDIAIILIKAGC